MALEMQESQDDSNEGRSGDGRRDRTPIETPDFFEERLPDLRDELGWTQEQLGRFFGVSKITGHRWEKHGDGETEARKAALRLVAECLKTSRAKGREVGKVLLGAGVVRAVTAALHRSPGMRNGGLDDSVGWREVFGVRDRLGWTQTEFALFLGVSHSVPAVWESGEGTFSDSIRAALLALDLSSDPHRPAYPEPHTSWDELKMEGFGAFCEEVLELQIGPDL